MPPLLHLHFGEKHGRGNGGNGHLAALRSTHAIEDVRLVAGGENASQRREWRAYDVHAARSEEHTSELQSHLNLVCRLLLEKKKKKIHKHPPSDTHATQPVQPH